MDTPTQKTKKEKAAGTTNASGKEAERLVCRMTGWTHRSCVNLSVLNRVMRKVLGVTLSDQKLDLRDFKSVQQSCFDAIELPKGVVIDWGSDVDVEHWFEDMTFREIKSCTQNRADPDFGGYQFSIPFAETHASQVLGERRYRFYLFNSLTGLGIDTTWNELYSFFSSCVPQWSVQMAKILEKAGGTLDLFLSQEWKPHGSPVTPIDLAHFVDGASDEFAQNERKVQRTEVEHKYPITPFSLSEVEALEKSVDKVIRRGRKHGGLASAEEKHARNTKRLLLTLKSLTG